MRYIKYIPKVTNAKTQYVTIDTDDMVWLQSEFIYWISLMGMLDVHRNEDIRQVMKFWWYKRSSTLPKGNTGQNSPLSLVSGLLHNLMFGTQRDLSTATMDAIENISAQMVLFSQALEEISINTRSSEQIKFVIGLSPFIIPSHDNTIHTMAPF
jgi:hypothetical protein